MPNSPIVARQKLRHTRSSLSTRGESIADELIGQPLRWQAQASLGRSAYALGDDEPRCAAYAEAGRLVDEFSATLAPERAAQLARRR